ncbi:MAG: hypothetical protein PHS73_00850 [Candidatus Peribacteraceae bacterium]|nr:hypothetical protein [Candidatus Peribacteraceae bacterium]
MKPYLFFSIGFLLLGLAASAQAEQQSYNLYERLREQYLKEQYIEDSEEEVREFIARQLGEVPAAEGGTQSVSADDVKQVLEGSMSQFCSSKKQSFGSCENIANQIRSLASDLGRMRGLGRDLLATAIGYEMGTDGTVGGPMGITSEFPAIIHVWQSGADHLLSPVRESMIRGAIKPPEDALVDAFEAVKNKLQDEEEKTLPLIIWRYRYGLTQIKREGGCEDKKGNGELFALQKQRWCDLEEALQEIVDALPTVPTEYDPPLKSGETLFFPIEPLDGVDHIFVWYFSRATPAGVTSDVGLSWDLAVEPALPGLLAPDDAEDCEKEMKNKGYCKVVKEKQILPGGLYPDPPPEPKENQGVCTLPLGRNGYLCRPQQLPGCTEEIERTAQSSSASAGAGSTKPGPRSIVLTECKPEQFKEAAELSVTGPDFCRLGGWRTPVSSSNSASSVKDTAQRDEKMKPDGCSKCVVDFYCGSCKNGGGGYTDPIDQDGVIRICLSTSEPPGVLPYYALHELIHAQQYCQLPNGSVSEDLFGGAEKCCARERVAYLATANAMAEDGIFDHDPSALEEYANAGPNESCGGYGTNACAAVDTNAVLKKIKEIIKKETKRLNPSPSSCEEFVNNLKTQDARVFAMQESLKKTAWPGCEVKYENTIGNNLCYVGQSIEESLEYSRLIPGRMTEGVQDESFPWDACATQDPKNGEVLPMPVISPVELPPYNPRLLLQSMDSALCQMSGLPPLSPPVLCGFNSTRRFNAPMEMHIIGFVAGLGNQQGEALGALNAAEGIGIGIANRLGTSITLPYMDRALQSLTALMTSANTLLTQVEDIRFPLSTCPRNAGEGNVCGQFP